MIMDLEANVPRIYRRVSGELFGSVDEIRSLRFTSLVLKFVFVVVLSVGEQGYLEGRCKEMEGWFPSNHVQDICVFSKFIPLRFLLINCLFIEEKGEVTRDDTMVISRDALSALMINNDAYTPRTVVLQRGRKGFGFVLRGSRGNYSLE